MPVFLFKGSLIFPGLLTAVLPTNSSIVRPEKKCHTHLSSSIEPAVSWHHIEPGRTFSERPFPLTPVFSGYFCVSFS